MASINKKLRQQKWIEEKETEKLRMKIHEKIKFRPYMSILPIRNGYWYSNNRVSPIYN